MSLREDQVAAIWSWPRICGVASTRTHRAARSMRRDLSLYRAGALRCAAELDERATGFLTRA
ncbi:hypothetical protein ACQUSR_33585 [Streptomyces sp. P1-3]|uniref:hypothetical protein n=1 Tax=Streptomyces sp. P1-3 TaxID=3421658 RepID=UPI003D36A643